MMQPITAFVVADSSVRVGSHGKVFVSPTASDHVGVLPVNLYLIRQTAWIAIKASLWNVKDLVKDL